MAGYDFTAIESKWQQYWQDNETFVQPNPGQEGFVDAPKMYVLDMFPYPSGAGLHVGHPEGYTATDIVSRYARMKGYNLLHPMGYDSFGLPAQQYAVEHGIHPRVTTERNMANIERQIKMFGFSYDWSRRVATTDPEYYRWTQWIFLQMFNSWYDPQANSARPIDELIDKLAAGQFLIDPGGNLAPAGPARAIEAIAGVPDGLHKFNELAVDQQRRVVDEHRLAYLAEVPVNWCPKLGTVLANEEVTNEGKSERGDHPVYRRALKQWMLRITAYADRLLEGMEGLDWPESIKIMQRNWIGRSQGAEVLFQVAGSTAVPAVTSALKEAARQPANLRPILTAQSFEGMDPYPMDKDRPEDLFVHIRNLPHLELPGATYFVTFSAVPGEAMDCQERTVVLEACTHWHDDRCCVFAAVVMDDHAHMILKILGDIRLGEVIHSIKSYTAHEINRLRGRKGAFWIGESFDHIIRDNWWFAQFINYICDNPVKRGLCDRFDSYEWLWVNAAEIRTDVSGKPFGHVILPADYRRDAHATDHRRDARATNEIIEVYTTRPDTLFGATYMVLAPEHPLVEEITTDQQRQEVRAYVDTAVHKSELERIAETKEKTGVFTGAYAVNPVNDKQIPIWVADYVMMGYGTGAIMAVPAHDTRDLAFAKQFALPVVQVVQPPEGVDWRGYVGDGVAINSGPYDGLATAEFKKKITEWLDEKGLGRAAVNYRIRDWIFSRQWYWGEPFPIVHCDKCGVVALSEDQLPLLLPDMEDFTPATSDDPASLPAPPLGRASEWVQTACPSCGGPATRELNAMPQWAGSCWYYLRFLDPTNDRQFCDPEIEKYWMNPAGSAGKSAARGVDLYVGGAEHAVLHLLYSRFWHKVLYDLGHVSTPEPFGKLFNQGMIRSFAYRDKRGVCVGYEDVDLSGEKPVHRTTGEVLAESIEKMSKSLKNVVNPDEIIAQYGADTFRLYEMFMGPLDASKPWNTRDLPGSQRFCQRVWRMILGNDQNGDKPLLADGDGDQKVEKSLHKLIMKVGGDIEAMKFNTAIAAMMEFVNTVFRAGRISKDQAERFILVVAPFAPHIGEELWQRLGHDKTLAYEPWPSYDKQMIVEETIQLAVQVNGKVRARLTVPADTDEETIIAGALAEKNVVAAIGDKQIVKKIVVPGRLVNLVVK